MGLFSKKIGPVILKEDSDAERFINDMTNLSQVASDTLKKDIEVQIKIANYGLAGEKNVLFELKNSGMDMYVLHDIYLESDGKGAQIDYLIITRKRFYVLECKNLMGNVTVNNDGSFIREYELLGKKIKEGIYSPITQNERHRLVIKEIREKEHGIFTKFLFNRNFDNNYISLVVLANPKTIVNAKYAKKEVKNSIIRADQLIQTIKDLDARSDNESMSESEMEKMARFFLEKDIAERSDYSKKYHEMVDAVKKDTSKTKEVKQEEARADIDEDKVCPRCGNKLVLRVAKKGDNAGKQFYGCSNFPHCRYIENIGD